MTKLINQPGDVVGEALDGLAGVVPTISLLQGWTTAVRSDVEAVRSAGRVTVVSGGGAGHEPAHAGYVGAGMLTAAVAGEVFSSPSVDAVLAAIRAVASPAGVLLIVKNYTGDRLNFGLAAELARAEDVPVEVVVVADDVALAAEGGAGRRGIAGTVFVHKVAGAAAEAGLPLAAVAARARAAADAVGSMGVGLSACTVPGADRPGFELGADEIEWGLGIHGEPGVERTTARSADDVARGLLDRIVTDRELAGGARVALLVNGLGATPPIELDVVGRAAVGDLRRRGIVVERVWIGNFLTALDMAGCSLSVLPVDDEVLAALDAPTTAPGWAAGHGGAPAERAGVVPVPSGQGVPAGSLSTEDPVRRALEAAGHRLLAAEEELTGMDRQVGDGDLGTSLARGARAVLAEAAQYPGDQGVAAVLRAASATVRRSIGGTSGPLYAVLLMRAAAALPDDAPAAGPRQWAAAFSAAVDGVQEVGGAEPGDCTMVDALRPAADALAAAVTAGQGPGAALGAAVAAAQQGTARTAELQARLGRSSYVGARAIGHPDPGAHAVALWLAAVAATLPG